MIEVPLSHDQRISLNEDPPRVHVFSEIDIQAVEAALGARRPLLLLGEPGIGKSQLAEAVAQSQNWVFVSKTVDALTEPGDLMWTEDAVSRLAEAQLAAASQGEEPVTVRKRLARENFIAPGVLWEAFDPGSAAATRGDAAPEPRRVVVLIDEIDKAESAVPNGLLEALGAERFSVPGRADAIRAGTWPLIVITSNDERPLPTAFVRRCVVHNMVAPVGEDFVEWLVTRGRAHYPADAQQEMLEHVARALNADREGARRDRLLPLPGLAEYLDLLRALFSQGPQDAESLQRRAAEIGQFFLRKARR